MQAPPPPASAYVEQIPPGARPPPRAAARVLPPAPAGLYLQVASAPDQPAAIRAGLELVGRLGSARPRYVRGVRVVVEGRARIRMYAGPVADAAAGRALCARALPPGSPCLLATLPADPRPR